MFGSGGPFGIGGTACLLSLLLPVAVHGATVDFDDFAVGGSFGLVAADRYRADGVVFDSQICIEDVAVAEPFFVSAFTAGGGTSPNFLVLATPIPTCGGSLEIKGTIVLPGTSVPATTNSIQVDAFDANVGNERWDA